MKKHTHGEERVIVYNLYIYKGDKWKNIGSFCPICGVHINLKALKENDISLSEEAQKISFEETVS